VSPAPDAQLCFASTAFGKADGPHIRPATVESSAGTVNAMADRADCGSWSVDNSVGAGSCLSPTQELKSCEAVLRMTARNSVTQEVFAQGPQG